MTQSHSTVQRIVPIHAFTSTPCILYPLTITESIVIISVSLIHLLIYFIGLSEDWECYTTLKSRPLEFGDELGRTATVHSHVHIYLKYYNDNPKGDLISII